jgi:uncharacterized protein YbcC (UPF0753/DUF2309 family)
MSLALGKKLSIRSMIYVAGEPIPFFWPMRNFIHHNPLHGLEKMHFSEAVRKAEKLFHTRTFLTRAEYQHYLDEAKISRQSLLESVKKISRNHDPIPGIDLNQWLMKILTNPSTGLPEENIFSDIDTVKQVIEGNDQSFNPAISDDQLRDFLNKKFPLEQPIYESFDLLHGTELGNELDELVIKACLDFFDEGQSVWKMPSRHEGFFKAWYTLATRNAWLSKRANRIRAIVESEESAEGVIAQVMTLLKVPEEYWISYFTRELSRLHGWVGFIRWRENANDYYWARQYPGDLVEYLAVRLTLSVILLQESPAYKDLFTLNSIRHAVEERTFETFLRYELYSGSLVPSLSQRVEETFLIGNKQIASEMREDYLAKKIRRNAVNTANSLTQLSELTGNSAELKALDVEQLQQLYKAIKDLEDQEGLIWLNALESNATQTLLNNLDYKEQPAREKRPFVQALFCIDTRSERIRRVMESVGDYQTYGIAGFFGVPFSFMELGKGSENYLCPILLTPKNLVLEISREEWVIDEAGLSALEKVLHDLKESILTPFVTVEAVGLLFGFDMLGKTLAPSVYNRWRKHLNHEKPPTQLLLDKLDRQQADSIVRAVQRAVIAQALENDLGIAIENITDDMIRELRERALGNQKDCGEFKAELGIDDKEALGFIEKLRTSYKINSYYSRIQLERLGRIGFSIDEQAGFVSTALRSIGLTGQFSRFVLLVGHGSTSENNPYESALDCGACGGDHGLVNARALAQMANKPQVRSRLKQQGLVIDDDVWFIPAFHNTTTDELTMHDLELLPSSHLIYIDRLRNGLRSASHLCALERLPELQPDKEYDDPVKAFADIQRNSLDWSQVRPEWGLSRNAYFIIGKRDMTLQANLEGRSFLHSYDYKADPKRRLLENILGGPLVVGQWINMEHYFSTVDNEHLGSGSKVYHNVAGRFGVMTGNLSDLRTGLPSQTVLRNGAPYHEPMRLITVIQAPFDHALKAVHAVASVKRLVNNYWIRLLIIDPETNKIHQYENDEWLVQDSLQNQDSTELPEENLV